MFINITLNIIIFIIRMCVIWFSLLGINSQQIVQISGTLLNTLLMITFLWRLVWNPYSDNYFLRKKSWRHSVVTWSGFFLGGLFCFFFSFNLISSSVRLFSCLILSLVSILYILHVLLFFPFSTKTFSHDLMV